MNNYTGRQIAIFTDVHAMYEPLKKVIDDIKKRNITEIYSLGDNISIGTNPKEVLDLLINNKVILINGNGEDYSIHGIKPYIRYFTKERKENQKWTNNQITKKQLNYIKKGKTSLDLIFGGKKIALCHFINDTRIDYTRYSTWLYQKMIRESNCPNRQFIYENSKQQLKRINIKSKSKQRKDRNYKEYLKKPMFQGKRYNYYDEIIQGHVHFASLIKDDTTVVRTLRGLANGYDKDEKINEAYYIILKEKEIGYDIEEVYVPYDKEMLNQEIDQSTLPHKERINKYAMRI